MWVIFLSLRQSVQSDSHPDSPRRRLRTQQDSFFTCSFPGQAIPQEKTLNQDRKLTKAFPLPLCMLPVCQSQDSVCHTQMVPQQSLLC